MLVYLGKIRLTKADPRKRGEFLSQLLCQLGLNFSKHLNPMLLAFNSHFVCIGCSAQPILLFVLMQAQFDSMLSAWWQYLCDAVIRIDQKVLRSVSRFVVLGWQELICIKFSEHAGSWISDKRYTSWVWLTISSSYGLRPSVWREH